MDLAGITFSDFYPMTILISAGTIFSEKTGYSLKLLSK